MKINAALFLQVPGPYNSYLASVLADAVRRELFDEGQTFTVRNGDVLARQACLMEEARQRGYRVYLYFVATDDPAINIDRVRRRVRRGGHPVPAKKVSERYVRSIGLMTEACGIAHRAFVFDTSGSRHKLLFQITDGRKMEIEAATLPRWFIETEIWKSFSG